jgi:hypothetical protein
MTDVKFDSFAVLAAVSFALTLGLAIGVLI